MQDSNRLDSLHFLELLWVDIQHKLASWDGLKPVGISTHPFPFCRFSVGERFHRFGFGCNELTPALKNPDSVGTYSRSYPDSGTKIDEASLKLDPNFATLSRKKKALQKRLVFEEND